VAEAQGAVAEEVGGAAEAGVGVDAVAIVGLIAALTLIRTSDSKAHVGLGAETATESSS
jgi:hypothetical protein